MLELSKRIIELEVFCTMNDQAFEERFGSSPLTLDGEKCSVTVNSSTVGFLGWEGNWKWVPIKFLQPWLDEMGFEEFGVG